MMRMTKVLQQAGSAKVVQFALRSLSLRFNR